MTLPSAKPAASLSSGLLARRGLAKPAMRRASVGLEDLGWNDMGDNVYLVEPALPADPPPERDMAVEAVPSPVALQIATLTESLAPAAAAPMAFDPAAVAVPAGRKAAFTLRLDPERHLRLRLMSAVAHQSAQHLLICALDTLIAGHPDIEALARDPKARATGNRED